MSSRSNEWFVPGEGISREVITADIQRYLGPDSLVRPGLQSGVSGYWVTAYRSLTSQMLQDLRSDSQRWLEAKKSIKRVSAYQDSSIHANRMMLGPTSSTPESTEKASSGRSLALQSPSKPAVSLPTDFSFEGRRSPATREPQDDDSDLSPHSTYQSATVDQKSLASDRSKWKTSLVSHPHVIAGVGRSSDRRSQAMGENPFAAPSTRPIHSPMTEIRSIAAPRAVKGAMAQPFMTQYSSENVATTDSSKKIAGRSADDSSTLEMTGQPHGEDRERIAKTLRRNTPYMSSSLAIHGRPSRFSPAMIDIISKIAEEEKEKIHRSTAFQARFDLPEKKTKRPLVEDDVDVVRYKHPFSRGSRRQAILYNADIAPKHEPLSPLSPVEAYEQRGRSQTAAGGPEEIWAGKPQLAVGTRALHDDAEDFGNQGTRRDRIPTVDSANHSHIADPRGESNSGQTGRIERWARGTSKAGGPRARFRMRSAFEKRMAAQYRKERADKLDSDASVPGYAEHGRTRFLPWPWMIAPLTILDPDNQSDSGNPVDLPPALQQMHTRETVTSHEGTTRGFWDRFEVATALEKFIMNKLTDMIRSEIVAESSDLDDAQDDVNSQKRQRSSNTSRLASKDGPSRKRRRKTGGSSRPDRNPDESDEESDDDDGLPHKRGSNPYRAGVRGLRCPFYCHDPDRYCQQACSSASGFPNMSRLVQHLKRGHWQKQGIRCPRCQGDFGSNQQLEEHLNADERCPKREKVKDDRISAGQWDDITEKRPKEYNDYSDEQKWQCLYKALFPDDGRTPSAYARPIMIDQLQDPLNASLEEVLAEEWGTFVCDTFQKLIDDLKAKMPTILQKAQEKVDLGRGTKEEVPAPASPWEIPVVKPPYRDKGKGKATDLTTDPALDWMQSPIPSLSDKSTGESSEVRLPFEDPMGQPVVLPDFSGTSYAENDTINPYDLGIMDFDSGLGDSDTQWDYSSGELLPMSGNTVKAGNGISQDSLLL